jgi:hypothetical protein
MVRATQTPAPRLHAVFGNRAQSLSLWHCVSSPFSNKEHDQEDVPVIASQNTASETSRVSRAGRDTTIWRP